MKDFQEEGFLRLFMSSQKHKLLNSSHHAPSGAARPHRGNGSCIHERCLENSLQTEQSVALVMQPMGLIGRWLLLVCWDKCISVGVEREVGGVFKAACRERETTRTGENGSGMTGRLDLSAYRIYSSSQSWSWGGILVCIVACFASKMTVSFQTDCGWFCDPFLNFCFVLVSLFLMKLWILGDWSCAVYVLNKQYNYYLFTSCCCIIP